MASQFGWEDTRRLAARDCSISYPEDESLLLEKYSYFADQGVTRRSTLLNKDKYFRTRFLNHKTRTKGKPFPPYLMNNADYIGKGAVQPGTGELYPEFARRQRYLEKEGICIGTWSALDSPAPQPTFRCPCMKLWRTPDTIGARAEGREEIGVPLPRPSLVKDISLPGGERETFFKGAPRIGARKALSVDGKPKRIALGGPGRLDDNSVYCILVARRQKTLVALRGLGEKRIVECAPESPVVAVLRCPWWRPMIARFEHVSFQAVGQESSADPAPCLMQIAFSPLEAAVILLDSGYPAQAAGILKSMRPSGLGHPFWRALSGDKESLPEAKKLLGRWKAIAGDTSIPASSVSADGVPLDIWQDFARIRLAPLQGLPFRKGDAVRLGDILPVAQAPQRLTLELDEASSSNQKGVLDSFRLHDAESRLPPPVLSANATATQTIESSSFRTLRLILSSTNRHCSATFRKIEYTWQWRDMLRRRAEQLEQAIRAMESTAPARPSTGDQARDPGAT